MPIYPAAPPTISGDTVTISRFLQSPTSVQRRLRTVTEQRFIADVLLTGRYEVSGGAILYEIGEGIYLDRDPEVVNPGAEYPRSSATPGTAAMAAVSKWGQDTPITDEHIKRFGRRAVDSAMLKTGNSIVRKVDTVTLAAIAAAVTQTQAVLAAWSATTADPFLDVMLADAQIEALDMGYETDTLVLKDVLYARMVANSKVLAGLARESANTVTSTGEVLAIAGKRILRSNRLPSGTDALLLDSTQLGGLGYERLESPEYTGDPANGVESWSRRDPDANDQWLLRGRRPVVPVVQEPASAIKITGAAA